MPLKGNVLNRCNLWVKNFFIELERILQIYKVETIRCYLQNEEPKTERHKRLRNKQMYEEE